MIRRMMTVGLPVVLLTVSGPAAFAAWTSMGGNTGSVTATSVNKAAAPSVEGGEGEVTISWEKSTLANGEPVGRYLVLRDGAEVCTSTDTTPLTASCVDAAPAGGQVAYRVVAAIGANWTGPASDATLFTYDNTAPGAPSAPDLVAADDTGSSSTDNVTNKSSVTVTGTAEAGSTVRIYRGATELGTGTATGGNYSIVIGLVSGSNTIHATATDAAGNVSASSTTTLILSDSAAPGAPSAPDLVAADDTGSSSTDNITNKSSVTVTGTAEAGSTVRIYRGATELGTGTATGGSYSIVIGLVSGSNTIHATATDAAGNVSASSTTTLILSDSAAPGAPSAPDLVAADDTGSSSTDNITNKSSVTVTGTAEAGSTVRIYRGATELGSGTATGGSYSIVIGLVSGSNTIHATATDAAGNVSASSTTTLILSDSAAPGAPSAPDLVAADDTGSSSTDNITNKSSVTVTGTAEAGSTVRIYRGASELGSGTATGGSYSIVIGLVSGSNTIHATATDAAGNVSAASTGLIITLDTTTPTVTGVALANGSSLGRADRDDTVTVSFSEPMTASNFCSNWTSAGPWTIAGNGEVTVTISNSGTNDILTVTTTSTACSALNLGSVALGGDYVSSNTTFSGNGANASEVSLTVGGQLKVTLGAGNGSAQNVGIGTPSYTPPSGLTDLAGNALGTAAVNGTGSRF